MRKKSVFLMLVTLCVAFLSSCSGNKKELTPTGTEFTSGMLASVIQVVDEPCEFTFSKKDGAIPSQTMRLKVKLKNMVGGGDGIDPQQISFTGLLSVATVKVTDKDGAELFTLNVADEEMLKLKKLIAGPKDGTAEIVFESVFHNSENANKWFKEAVHFTPYLSADISEKDLLNAATALAEMGNSVATSTIQNDDSNIPLENISLPSQLKGKVEIVSAEKGISSIGYPEVSITFKLTGKVNTSSLCNAGGQLWIVGVGESENGAAVKSLLPSYGEWRSGDSDGEQFKEFLEGDVDETITLDFSGDKNDDVEADLDKVKKFKLKLTK